MYTYNGFVNPYAVFAGDNYYPSGGMQDLVGRFSNLDAARLAMNSYDWGHIVNLDTFEIVERK